MARSVSLIEPYRTKSEKQMSVLAQKSYAFAIRIVKCRNHLQKKKEYTLSKQLLRSGTAIGALISEGRFAESKQDFSHKLQIALKEANESKYWLRLLRDTSYLEEPIAASLLKDNEEIINLLVKSIKTLKGLKQ